MAESWETTKALSELLDLHLSRTINRLKPMTKFSEIADRIKRQRADLEKRADTVIEKMDTLDSKAEEIFAKHEGALKASEAGLKEIEQALLELAGSNNPPNEDDGKGAGGVATFPLGANSLGTG